MDNDEYPQNSKAADFVEACDAAEWDVEWEEHWDLQRAQVDLWARRGQEEIRVGWDGSRFTSGEYTSDGGKSHRKLGSVGAARERLAGDPLPPPRRGRQPKDETNGSIVEDPGIRLLPRSLPFALDVDDDEAIIDAVRGRTLVWWNSTSLDYEKAVVAPARQKQIRIEETSAGRVLLTFISPEGWRSVAFDNLVQVRK